MSGDMEVNKSDEVFLELVESVSTLSGHITALVVTSEDALYLQPGLLISLDQARKALAKAGIK